MHFYCDRLQIPRICVDKPKTASTELWLRPRSFCTCRPRSKPGIFNLPAKFSLGLATKPFSDSLLGLVKEDLGLDRRLIYIDRYGVK